jgi:signal transduction histidine kinase
MSQLIVVLVVVALVVGALLGVGAGWVLARRNPPPDPHVPDLQRLAGELASGRRPGSNQSSAEVGRVVEALERGWVPRNEGREQSLREALGRIAAFLREQLRGPLEQGLRKGTPEALRDGAERALGGLDDLEFFLREPLTPDEVHNLVPLVQQVTREFTSDWEVAVRMRADDKPVRAHIHRDTFLDAVYLLLHNAGQFGNGTTVDVSVLQRDGKALVTIRDRGPGFSPEALERAHDLFYTTSPSSLGLGIPFARKIIESFGGEIGLRNLEDGGAEVELTLPSA